MSTVVVAAALPPAPAAVVERLREHGSRILIGARVWRWGGALWRCTGDDAERPSAGCIVTVTATGWSAVLAGVAPPDQQDGVAGVRVARRTDLLVTPPGGMLSQPLLDALRPVFVGEPMAPNRRAVAPGGAEAAATGEDGDLVYRAAPSGTLVRD